MNTTSITTEVKTLYPFTFEPVLLEKVWAGELLASVPKNIGEVWTVVDRSNHQSVISNGFLQGKTLKELIGKYPESILGKGKRAKDFPVLVKLIDAGDRLSVQVHPGENNSTGSQSKSEMWYVLEAEETAEVYVGFNDQYPLSKIKGSLQSGEIVDLLNRSEPVKGDSYFIPAGTVHSLGAGNLVLEIQQNSDSTYRLYDWDRVDENGLGRELHIDSGLKSIKPVRYKQGTNWEIEQPLFSLKEIIDTDWATVFEVSGNYSLNCRHESCFIISAVSEVSVSHEATELNLIKGGSTLIPASLNNVTICGEKWLLTKVK